MAQDQVSDLKVICHPAETSYLPATSRQSLHLKNQRAMVLRRDSPFLTHPAVLHPVDITSPTIRTFGCKSLSGSKRWKDNSHERDLVSLQPVRCLPVRPYVPCCQPPGLQSAVSHYVTPPSPTHPTHHDISLPSPPIFQSPSLFYLPTTTTGPDLCSQRTCFWPCSQSPGSTSLASGSYPQRKGQTIRETYDPSRTL